jgi:hypothetical protein
MMGPGSLTPEVERTPTCPCPIEAGPFALEMTRIPEPCDKITPRVLAQNTREQVQGGLQGWATL